MDLEWLTQHRSRQFRSWIKSEQTVLEFGARDLFNLKSIAAATKCVCSPRAARTSFESEGIQVYENAANLRLSFADVIICDEILEYLPEPINTLLGLKAALKPGGLMIVHALYDPDFRKPRFDRTVDHYYSWNVQTLGNLLIDCGFNFIRGEVKRLPEENKVIRLGE